MEEVDKILLHSLRQAGTEIPPELQSVGQLTPELLVAAAVGILRRVRPALGTPLSPLLPPSISARFRLASQLASACQELGFGGDIGYQTFLYSSEHEWRRLLLFLLEKLPRDEGDAGDEPPGKSGALLRAVAARIREQLETPWVPPNCRPPRLRRLQGTGCLHPFVTSPLLLPQSGGPPELQEYFGSAAPPVPAQPPLFSRTPPSLLEAHGLQLSSELGGPRLTPEDPLGRQRLRARLQALESLRTSLGPPLGTPKSLGPPQGSLDPAWLQEAFGGLRGVLPKGSRFTRSQQLTHQQDPQLLLQQIQVVAEPISPSKTPQEAPALEEAALEEALAQVEAQIRACQEEIKGSQLRLIQMEEEVERGQGALGGREEELRLKARAVELLPEAQTNVAKLQLLVESSSRRILSLVGQWERHRGPLLSQLRHLRALRDSRQLESSRLLSQLRSLRERRRAAAAEAQRKEQLHRQLVSELEALPQDVSRAVYTQRILELVGSIRKQKEEIDKILLDTRGLQKEINSLVGKLERTFSVTDELLFKDAKRDEVVRKAYKYLAALHENCAQLIQTIEDTGTIQREIRDLEEQLEAEWNSKPRDGLERILSDCRALREENQQLLAQLPPP
ncbi:coiled-coil domain-containing protein 22 isoform X2 [Colius striatus]|uniref:coiled-coil domain-containing protein 22 isoform X2 n=1 Tax=Colius striatus TaxID=57412 RepID=UPI002B1E1345|nr:coiled-coil domain-containing protein 22 isoform X2 [Colius striatus]